MLDVQNLVQHMKRKGITFCIESEHEAIKHLSSHNNYFKLTAYRKNYSKKTSGPNVGQYENLDFEYLVELARIDTEIRHLLLQMALDIEHFIKVSLIKAVEDNIPKGEDGYKIISGYLDADEKTNPSDVKRHSSSRSNSLNDEIAHNTNNPYCGGLISKYKNDMPVWAFVELCTFGDLIKLCTYYQDKGLWEPPVDLKSLSRVRQIRNACAHGNCIINDLNPVKKTVRGKSAYPRFISAFLSKAEITVDQSQKKMQNPRINQLVHLLYIYDSIVQSPHTRNLRLKQLKDLVNCRMKEKANYFYSNILLVTTYRFFKKIIDNLAYIS